MNPYFLIASAAIQGLGYMSASAGVRAEAALTTRSIKSQSKYRQLQGIQEHNQIMENLEAFKDTNSSLAGVMGRDEGSDRSLKRLREKATNGNDFLGTFTVSGGQIDASSVKTGITQAFIGYAFTPTLKTLPIDAQIQGGPLTGEPRQIPKVVLDLFETLAVNVTGPNTTSTTRDLVIRNVTDDMSADRPPVTGKEEFRLLGYSRDPRVTVSQSFPLDLQINGMIVEVAF